MINPGRLFLTNVSPGRVGIDRAFRSRFFRRSPGTGKQSAEYTHAVCALGHRLCGGAQNPVLLPLRVSASAFAAPVECRLEGSPAAAVRLPYRARRVFSYVR